MTFLKNSNTNIVFCAKADLKIISDYILNGIIIIFLIYLILNFNERPGLISVIIGFLLFVLLLPKRDIVIVYDTAIEFTVQNNIFNKLSKRRYFPFEQITEIDANLQMTRKIFAIKTVINSSQMNLAYINSITIRFISGKEIEIISDIFKEDLITAFEKVKELTKEKIKVIY
jgi:hypothetical protein